MATTKEQILGVAADNSTQQTAGNVHEAVAQQQQQEHSNGGVQAPSDNNAMLANQSGNAAVVQTGENIVQKPQDNANTAKVETASVQTDANKAAEQKSEESAATKPVTDAAPATAKKPLTYVEMFQQLSGYTPPTKEELEKERKKQRRKAIFAAIGDGVSALANLYFVGQHGALNAYDPKQNMTSRLRAQWDKQDAERKANADKYLSGYMNAMKMDADEAKYARNWKHQLEREGVADKRAEDQIAYGKERDALNDQWRQKQWDNTIEQQRIGNEHWQQQFDESKRKFNVNKSLQQQQMAESRRQHNASLAIQQQALLLKAAAAGQVDPKDAYSIRLRDGSVKTYDKSKSGALTALLPKMIQKAQKASKAYGDKHDSEKSSYYLQLAMSLKEAKTKDAQLAAVTAYAWDFPSLDKEVRQIIGADGGFNVQDHKRGGGGQTVAPPLN